MKKGFSYRFTHLNRITCLHNNPEATWHRYAYGPDMCTQSWSWASKDVTNQLDLWTLHQWHSQVQYTYMVQSRLLIYFNRVLDSITVYQSWHYICIGALELNRHMPSRYTLGYATAFYTCFTVLASYPIASSYINNHNYISQLCQHNFEHNR